MSRPSRDVTLWRLFILLSTSSPPFWFPLSVSSLYYYIYCVLFCLILFIFYVLQHNTLKKLIKLFCQSYKNLHFCNPRLPNGAQIKTKRDFFLLHIIGWAVALLVQKTPALEYFTFKFSSKKFWQLLKKCVLLHSLNGKRPLAYCVATLKRSVLWKQFHKTFCREVQGEYIMTM